MPKSITTQFPSTPATSRPRYLANAQEIATTAGALVPGIAQIADGVEEMRKVFRETIGLSVDQIKLSISEEEITGSKVGTDTYITEEELQVALDEAHRRHVRVCTHARSRDSVIIYLKPRLDMIYRASYIDDEGMDHARSRQGADVEFIGKRTVDQLQSILVGARTQSNFFPGSPSSPRPRFLKLLTTTSNVRSPSKSGADPLLPQGAVNAPWS